MVGTVLRVVGGTVVGIPVRPVVGWQFGQQFGTVVGSTVGIPVGSVGGRVPGHTPFGQNGGVGVVEKVGMEVVT